MSAYQSIESLLQSGEVRTAPPPAPATPVPTAASALSALGQSSAAALFARHTGSGANPNPLTGIDLGVANIGRVNPIAFPEAVLSDPARLAEWTFGDRPPTVVDPTSGSRILVNGWDPTPVTLLSVYPVPVKCEFRPPQQTIYIPGAPRGEFRLYRVHNGWESVRRLAAMGTLGALPGSPGSGSGQESLQEDHPVIPAALRVEDFLNRYCYAAFESSPGMHIGVIPIAGLVPTIDEFYHAILLQMRYFARVVARADKAYDDMRNSPNRNAGEFSFELPRLYLQWLGDDDQSRHPWAHTVSVGNTLKSCFGCGAQILAASQICDKCGTDIPRLYADRADIGITPESQGEPELICRMTAAIVAKRHQEAERQARMDAALEGATSQPQAQAPATPAPASTHSKK